MHSEQDFDEIAAWLSENVSIIINMISIKFVSKFDIIMLICKKIIRF